MTEVKFEVGYDLETTLNLEGTRYRARVGCHRGNSSPEVFETLRTLVGTVLNDSSPHEFPSEEAMESIREYMGLETLVAVRYSDDFKRVEYLGHRPPPLMVWEDHSCVSPEYFQSTKSH